MSDFIIIISILLLYLLVRIILCFNSNSDSNIVKITVNGKQWGQYSLDINQVIEINTDYGSNTVVINNNSVCISNASCKDKTCIKEGHISNSMQSIICIPNRLSITIYNDEEEAIDGYAY